MATRSASLAGLGLTAALLAGAAALAQQPMAPMPGMAETAPAASATILDATGAEVGTASFVQAAAGVIVTVTLHGVPAGGHGVHVHETGRCEGPEFTSAGGHWNPGGGEHGYHSEGGPHAGDLPNIHVAEDGAGMAEFFTTTLSFAGDVEAPLLDDDGAALMIHESADDYGAMENGHSGGRIACGVIEAASAP